MGETRQWAEDLNRPGCQANDRHLKINAPLPVTVNEEVVTALFILIGYFP